jgi:hypothetical protein
MESIKFLMEMTAGILIGLTGFLCIKAVKNFLIGEMLLFNQFALGSLASLLFTFLMIYIIKIFFY